MADDNKKKLKEIRQNSLLSSISILRLMYGRDEPLFSQLDRVL